MKRFSAVFILLLILPVGNAMAATGDESSWVKSLFDDAGTLNDVKRWADGDKFEKAWSSKLIGSGKSAFDDFTKTSEWEKDKKMLSRGWDNFSKTRFGMMFSWPETLATWEEPFMNTCERSMLQKLRSEKKFYLGMLEQILTQSVSQKIVEGKARGFLKMELAEERRSYLLNQLFRTSDGQSGILKLSGDDADKTVEEMLRIGSFETRFIGKTGDLSAGILKFEIKSIYSLPDGKKTALEDLVGFWGLENLENVSVDAVTAYIKRAVETIQYKMGQISYEDGELPIACSATGNIYKSRAVSCGCDEPSGWDGFADKWNEILAKFKTAEVAGFGDELTKARKKRRKAAGMKPNSDGTYSRAGDDSFTGFFKNVWDSTKENTSFGIKMAENEIFGIHDGKAKWDLPDDIKKSMKPADLLLAEDEFYEKWETTMSGIGIDDKIEKNILDGGVLTINFDVYKKSDYGDGEEYVGTEVFYNKVDITNTTIGRLVKFCVMKADEIDKDAQNIAVGNVEKYKEILKNKGVDMATVDKINGEIKMEKFCDPYSHFMIRLRRELKEDHERVVAVREREVKKRARQKIEDDMAISRADKMDGAWRSAEASAKGVTACADDGEAKKRTEKMKQVADEVGEKKKNWFYGIFISKTNIVEAEAEAEAEADGAAADGALCKDEKNLKGIIKKRKE